MKLKYLNRYVQTDKNWKEHKEMADNKKSIMQLLREAQQNVEKIKESLDETQCKLKHQSRITRDLACNLSGDFKTERDH